LLLIDDEADVQYSFRRIFDSLEIELTTASSGEEVEASLKDHTGPGYHGRAHGGGMNGLETLRRIRATDAKYRHHDDGLRTTQTAIEAMKLGPTIICSSRLTCRN